MFGRNDKKMLSDAKFYQAMVDSDAGKIKHQLLSHMNSSKNASLSDLLDAVSSQMAQLNGRIKVLETIVASDLKLHNQEDLLGSKAMEGMLGKGNDIVHRLDAEMLSTNVNCHELEKADNGLSYCWTAEQLATDFTVILPSDGQYQFMVGVMQAVSAEIMDSIELRINGQTIAHEWVDDNSERFIAAKKQCEAGSVRISIKVSKTVCPLDLGTSPDIRRLGVALTSVVVKKA